MCGRYALTAPAAAIAAAFELDLSDELPPLYNIAPTSNVPGVIVEEGVRTLRMFRWGLVPRWATSAKMTFSTINARADHLLTSSMYRGPFQRQRMLAISDGFYEWERTGPKTKIPHLIGLADGAPFGMAAVWERARLPAGEEIRSCSIITTEPNELMQPIHDRMPAILPREAWQRWLDPDNSDTDSLVAMLRPYPAAGMRERRVSSRVGNVKNQDADVQGPWEGGGP